jgi:ribokinase
MTAPSVIVVGSVNMDLLVQVPNLPHQGETVSGGTFARALGGKGANQAAAAAKLGARVWLVGLTGRDEFGREARQDLANFGVDISTLGYSSKPTGVASILVDGAGQNMIAVASGANHDLTGPEVSDRLGELPVQDAVLLANLEVPDEAVVAAAESASRRGWRFVLDPAPARALPQSLLALCAILTPNEAEAEALGSVESLLGHGVGAVVLTLGAEGAQVHRSNGSAVHQRSMPVEVVDSTGAGDAFNGTLAWSLASGHGLDDAVRWATAAGALACRELGARASLPDREELERVVEAWRNGGVGHDGEA